MGNNRKGRGRHREELTPPALPARLPQHAPVDLTRFDVAEGVVPGNRPPSVQQIAGVAPARATPPVAAPAAAPAAAPVQVASVAAGPLAMRNLTDFDLPEVQSAAPSPAQITARGGPVIT